MQRTVQRGHRRPAGICHQDVDPAEPPQDTAHEARDLRGPRQIDPHRDDHDAIYRTLPDLLRGRLQLPAVAGADNDMCTFARKCRGGRLPESLARRADHRHPVPDP
jgi:hypothetical protein